MINNAHISTSQSKTWLDLFVIMMIAYDILTMVTGGFVISFLRWSLLAWYLLAFVRNFANVHKSPTFVKMLTVLFVMFLVYGLIVIVEKKDFITWRHNERTIRSFTYLLQICFSLLPVFVFYYYGKIGVLTKEYLIRRLPLFFITMYLCYHFTGVARMAYRGAEDVTNNAGYIVLSIIPMLMFLKPGSLKQYLYLGFCLILIVFSVKRGAIIISLALAGIFFLYLFRKTTGLKKFFVIFALIVGMIGAYSVFDKMLDSSSYFQERVDDTMEGDSSGRDVIYEFFWNYYRNNTTQEEFLVGMGANATLDIFGQYAHNDWLEIAINQGLLGIVIYLLYWISFLRLLRKKKLPPDVKVALWMLFMIGFLKTLFSMSYREYSVYYSMVLGYCVAIANNNGCAVKKR